MFSGALNEFFPLGRNDETTVGRPLATDSCWPGIEQQADQNWLRRMFIFR